MKTSEKKYYFWLGCAALLFLSACGGAGNGGRGPLSAAEAKGEKLFAQHCAACHTTSSDTVIVGPPLAEIASTAGARVEGVDAIKYLRASILHPEDYLVEGFDNLMPATFKETLTEEEVEALILYLQTLK